jgi:O-antigen/teichoic acid export membrane protein
MVNRFARRVFAVAGIYGLVVLLPQYFMERTISRDAPPAITHPEYFYGFIGLAVAWQLCFLAIARDPVRMRPAMLPAVAEKLSFALPAVVLYAQHRLAGVTLAFASIDLVLAVLFALAYRGTAPGRAGG